MAIVKKQKRRLKKAAAHALHARLSSLAPPGQQDTDASAMCEGNDEAAAAGGEHEEAAGGADENFWEDSEDVISCVIVDVEDEMDEKSSADPLSTILVLPAPTAKDKPLKSRVPTSGTGLAANGKASMRLLREAALKTPRLLTHSSHPPPLLLHHPHQLKTMTTAILLSFPLPRAQPFTQPTRAHCQSHRRNL